MTKKELTPDELKEAAIAEAEAVRESAQKAREEAQAEAARILKEAQEQSAALVADAKARASGIASETVGLMHFEKIRVPVPKGSEANLYPPVATSCKNCGSKLTSLATPEGQKIYCPIGKLDCARAK